MELLYQGMKHGSSECKLVIPNWFFGSVQFHPLPPLLSLLSLFCTFTFRCRGVPILVQITGLDEVLGPLNKEPLIHGYSDQYCIVLSVLFNVLPMDYGPFLHSSHMPTVTVAIILYHTLCELTFMLLVYYWLVHDNPMFWHLLLLFSNPVWWHVTKRCQCEWYNNSCGRHVESPARIQCVCLHETTAGCSWRRVAPFRRGRLQPLPLVTQFQRQGPRVTGRG